MASLFLALILNIAPGLGLGVNSGLDILGRIVDSYEHEHLYTWSGKLTETIVARTTRFLSQYKKKKVADGIYKVADIYIYSPEYFCPKNYYTGELHITANTRSIHHYTSTWVKVTDNVWSKVKKRTTMFSYRFYGSLIWPLLRR